MRMRPLSEERPKSLLPVLDVPLLAWQLHRLSSAGIERAWVNAHWHAESIERAVTQVGPNLGMDLSLSLEADEPLGTAGALRRLAPHLTEAFLVANADADTDVPFERLVAAHRSAAAAATLLAVPVEQEADFVVEESWVAGLVDRHDPPVSGHRYGGIGVFEPEILRLVPEGPSGLYETVMHGLAVEGRAMAVLEWDGYWRDVGTPAAYLRANLDALSGTLGDEGLHSALGLVPLWRDDLVYLGVGSRVEGAHLRHSIVGSKAKVAPGTSLERCVVWDGAEPARGDYRDCVITQTRVVDAR